MSVLDIAAAVPAAKIGGPVQFTALREPIYDEKTGRTYQLVARVSDTVPHALSCAGNHSAALDAVNTARTLAFERGQLDDVKTATADQRREEIKTALAALVKVSCERADRTARMLQAYGERGVK